MKNKYVLPIIASLTSIVSLGAPISVFAEEKDIPINITVEATPISATLPTSIELANAGDTVDVTVASTNKIINNANTGTVHIDSIRLETLNSWSLGDKTAKYEEMAKDSKNLYLGIKLSDEADFANLKESYTPVSKEIKAKSEKGLLFEGKTNIVSSKLVSQVGNLVVTVSEGEDVVQNGNLKKGFLDYDTLTKTTEISFVTTQDNINSSQSWDASVEGDGSVMAWVDKDNPTKILIGAKNGKVVAPEDSSSLFGNTLHMRVLDVTNLDVSNVTDMSYMFCYTGYSSTDTNFEIKGLDAWDVSNVTNMSYTFSYIGVNAHNWSIGDLSQWDVSNVTNMSYMFSNTGSYATAFDIGNLSKWNVSNVINMSYMFKDAGKETTTFDIGDLSKWDISNVTNMREMFKNTGNKATIFHIGDLEGWNVSHRLDNVNKIYIFDGTGVAASFTPPSWYNPKEVDPGF